MERLKEMVWPTTFGAYGVVMLFCVGYGAVELLGGVMESIASAMPEVVVLPSDFRSGL